MSFRDVERNIEISGDFPTGSAGDVIVEDGCLTVLPKPEPVPNWFYEALQVNFGGAGVPREYAFHVRVESDVSQTVRLRFRFTETNGAGYMDPPYWTRTTDSGWRLVPSADVTFVFRSHCEISLKLEVGRRVYVANKPYPTPETVSGEMAALAEFDEGFSVREYGRTEDGIPLIALETEPRDERILVNATMQPAEPAARPVLFAAHALTDGSAMSHRLRERFQFSFVPMPNPDGAYHGMSVTNGHGEVPMFSFGRHLEGLETPVETSAFWSYVETFRPTGHVEFHTHYQDTRSHKLNPVATDWFADEATRRRANDVTNHLLEMNQNWRVTELAPDTPIVKAGKFVNMAEQFGTIANCYQIYAVSEEATCHHAVSAVQRLAEGLAGEGWRNETFEAEIVKG